ncbi:D-lactate dehydrogenase-like protein [Pontimonas salivibrio]|uniref:D-lactate dehydrogenase-like protein n=1 Tax=Pontimonas salivibrio TaxID=1159327 RepID=A0A2L2BRK8_9MICO|nr:NAD(P)-dependent oxidoreductase [Pontimonas salivibrio]AVG24305.1 D-lactate dehydrogenase-like protein [Pontimonas salivibrio]
MNHVVWTQWSDLDVPDGITLLGPDTAPLDSDAIKDVTFYVPPYMTGHAGLAPVNSMPKLQYLQMPNAGYDDAIEYRREGLDICNARGVHDISTAELALTLTLSSLRGIDDFVRAQPSGDWLQGPRPSLAYKRVGLVGYGSIGKTIASLLAPFHVDLVPFNRSGSDGATTMDQLDSLLPTFDVVILILPATPETTKLFDAKRLSLMKDGALLVNVARGVIVDTDALVQELNSGRIRAALDVMDPEPLPADHPLWQVPGVIISPHVGGNSSAFEPGMRALLATQLDRLAQGQEPMNIVVRGMAGQE